jgi:membrane protease YdiL (CAAX protease family)
MQPPALSLRFRHLLLIMLAQLVALTAQAWVSRILHARGYGVLQSHYLAYLVVPPILAILLAPVLMRYRVFLSRLFSPQGVSVRLLLAAAALALAARLAWWASLAARIALGLTASADPQAIAGPVFSWACPPWPGLALALLVMAVLIPVMEETVHRGLLQSAFVHRGPVTAILVSALTFTALHPPSSYGLVFCMGLVLGTQFWLSGSLWPTIVTHATYNGLVQFDWRCLQGQWNPPPESLPLAVPAAIALAALAASLLLIAGLLHLQRAGAPSAPAPAASRARSQRAR